MSILDFLKIYVHGIVITFLSWFFIFIASDKLMFLVGYDYPVGIIIVAVIVLVYPLVMGVINICIYRYFYDREDEISFPVWTNGLVMFLICSLFFIVYDITKQFLILLFAPILIGLYGKLSERD
jgi:hypothetical protein